MPIPGGTGAALACELQGGTAYSQVQSTGQMSHTTSEGKGTPGPLGTQPTTPTAGLAVLTWTPARPAACPAYSATLLSDRAVLAHHTETSSIPSSGLQDTPICSI